MTDTEARARAHTFAGGAALVIAAGAVPLFGLLAGLSMALVGAGNLVAAHGVRRTGAPTRLAWALMAIGVAGFVAAVVVLLTHAR